MSTVSSEKRQLNVDVWSPWEQPATPFLLSLTVEPCGTPFRQYFGVSFFTSILIYQGGDVRWLYRPVEARACGCALVDALTSPSFRQHFESSYDQAAAELLAAARSVRGRDLAPLDVGDLRASLEEYLSAFSTFYKLGAVTEPVMWHCEATVDALLGQGIGFKLDDLTEVREALFAPAVEPYATSIDAALAVVAEELERCGGYDHDVADPAALAAIASFETKYGWRANNYSRIGSPEVVADLARLAANGEPASRELRERVARARVQREQAGVRRAVILRGASEALANAVTLFHDCGAVLQDRRKAVIYEALSGLDALGRAIGRVLGLGDDVVSWLLPWELIDDGLEAADLMRYADARREGFIQTISAAPLQDSEMSALLGVELAAGCSRFEVGVPSTSGVMAFEGEDADAVLAQLDLRLGFFADAAGGRPIRGQVVVAAPGDRLEAPCKVVRDPNGSDGQAFERGDVLVATSTTPDFEPLMHLASAIITNEGGQGSHAALLARENRIPCVIGTRYATDVLASGQDIVIDFTTGTVSVVG